MFGCLLFRLRIPQDGQCAAVHGGEGAPFEQGIGGVRHPFVEVTEELSAGLGMGRVVGEIFPFVRIGGEVVEFDDRMVRHMGFGGNPRHCP